MRTEAVRRTWGVASLSMLVVLAACDRSPKPIAVYDGTPVHPDELVAELNYLLDEGETFPSLGLTPEGFLEQYVRFQLLLEEAKRSFQGLSPSEQARFALYQESLVRDALIDDLYESPPAPDEARIQALYEQRAQDERAFSYLRVQDRALADSARAWIRSGTSFEDALSRLQREHPARTEGGSLGYNRRGELPPEWEAGAWELEPGEVTEVIASPAGTFALLRYDDRRLTPMDVMRPILVRELREEVRAARRRALDVQLLQEARFEIDSTTVRLVAGRFASHRDSLAARGQLPAQIGLPPFSTDELARRLFVVLGQPFTVESFLSEVGQFNTGSWTPGREEELLLDIARRRALSVVLQQVAFERGIYQRPEIQARLERKRSEFMMNGLLRQVWSGVEVSDEDLRRRLEEAGQVVPGQASLEQMRERLLRDLQNARLQEFVDQIVARHEIELYPERFSVVLDQFEAQRLAAASAPS